VATASLAHPPHVREDGRIGFLGVFTAPAVETAFRERHFRDDRWLGGFLVVAGMIRVTLFLAADYRHFGAGPAFGLMCASRVLFLLVSAWVFVALRRAASPAAADRLFAGWCLVLITMTVHALATRPPGNDALLLMSFGMIVVGYCLTPLPLPGQASLTLGYSAAALYACRHAGGATLATVAATYGMAHVFGAVTSWRLNHRRREQFLGERREAGLRAQLEAALAEVRTLRGLVCICAWCKRVRDEAEAWQAVEKYVQNRTHASFSHGICPDCLQSQVEEMACVRA